MEEDISGNLHTIKEESKHNKYKSFYHINLRKSEKNIKELGITFFLSYELKVS